MKVVLEKNNLLHKPGQIYNIDESGISLDHLAPRVLTKKGQKKFAMLHQGTNLRSQLSAFVILDAKNLNMEWTKGEVPGTTYGLSDSGWMEMRLFKDWVTKHILHHVGLVGHYCYY